MTNIFKEAIKARKEASWWQYAAWTLPFVAIAIIVFSYWIGTDTWIKISIVSITVTFFTVSVFWWWWAVRKFAVLLTAMNDTNKNFIAVKDGLKEIRDEIRNDSNR